MSHIARDIVTKASAMAAAAILCLVAIPSPAHAYPVDPVQYVNEDEPGWDCHTMGNHVCGPVADVPWSEQYPDEATQDATPPADDTGLFPDPFDGPEQEPFDIVGVDGVTHHGCTIEVDEPSSHLICDDGYAEES
jgi:hypothetical protein